MLVHQTQVTDLSWFLHFPCFIWAARGPYIVTTHVHNISIYLYIVHGALPSKTVGLNHWLFSFHGRFQSFWCGSFRILAHRPVAWARRMTEVNEAEPVIVGNVQNKGYVLPLAVPHEEMRRAMDYMRRDNE